MLHIHINLGSKFTEFAQRNGCITILMGSKNSRGSVFTPEQFHYREVTMENSWGGKKHHRIIHEF